MWNGRILTWKWRLVATVCLLVLISLLALHDRRADKSNQSGWLGWSTQARTAYLAGYEDALEDACDYRNDTAACAKMGSMDRFGIPRIRAKMDELSTDPVDRTLSFRGLLEVARLTLIKQSAR